jgi:adenylate cyclase
MKKVPEWVKIPILSGKSLVRIGILLHHRKFYTLAADAGKSRAILQRVHSGCLATGVEAMALNGSELVPVRGGDPIPLLRLKLVIGRRESCDICLRFPNISGRHCELTFQDGYWTIHDLRSTNGVRVNDELVSRKNLLPGDRVTIATHEFTIEYSAAGTNTLNELMEDNIMDQPLLEKAGLIRPRRERRDFR